MPDHEMTPCSPVLLSPGDHVDQAQARPWLLEHALHCSQQHHCSSVSRRSQGAVNNLGLAFSFLAQGPCKLSSCGQAEQTVMIPEP